MMDQAGNSPPNTEIRTAPTANALPVILPPLRSIWTMPISPRMNETARTMRLTKKVKTTHNSLGLSIRGIPKEMRLGDSNTKPQRAQIKDAVANVLILTSILCCTAGACVSEQPQELQY